VTRSAQAAAALEGSLAINIGDREAGSYESVEKSGHASREGREGRKGC